jgi:hypothetical protein
VSSALPQHRRKEKRERRKEIGEGERRKEKQPKKKERRKEKGDMPGGIQFSSVDERSFLPLVLS